MPLFNALKLALLICGLSSFPHLLNAQGSGVWIAFEEGGLVGFKDEGGHVKIPAKFVEPTIAQKIDHIAAVTENIRGKYHSYYLTTNGRTIGNDSLYFFDNEPDCESEGFIRFHDKLNDKVGMLDGDGNVVIPAEYDWLSNVRNGFIVAIKESSKKFDGEEHYSWVGGRTLLLDTKNSILIENFFDTNDLNFFSVAKSARPSSDETKTSFLASDGQFYSFIDYQKEFENWFKSKLTGNLTRENLTKILFEQVTYWDKTKGWTSESKELFMERNYEKIKSDLAILRGHVTDDQIFSEGLNRYIFSDPLYNAYFNNCGEAMEWLHPVKTMVITHRKSGKSFQDHLAFLRTNQGYKLIQVSLKDE